MRKEKNVPGVIVPRMTCEPPYQMIPATPMTPTASSTGEVMAATCVDFIKERKYATLCRAKRRSSADSCVKPFTMRMPVSVSCKAVDMSAVRSWPIVAILLSRLPNRTIG